MHLERCVCAAIPSLTLRTRLVLLLHFEEAKKPTNTGRLAALAVTDSEVHIRGARDVPLDLASLADPSRRAVVLTPSDDAVPLDAAFLAKDPRPITLVVPDGSWRQASKMPRREPALRRLERVRLVAVPQPPSTTRREPREDGLSTLAAIAHALTAIEDGGAALLALDRLVTERTLESRGLRKD